MTVPEVSASAHPGAQVFGQNTAKHTAGPPFGGVVERRVDTASTWPPFVGVRVFSMQVHASRRRESHQGATTMKRLAVRRWTQPTSRAVVAVVVFDFGRTCTQERPATTNAIRFVLGFYCIPVVSFIETERRTRSRMVLPPPSCEEMQQVRRTRSRYNREARTCFGNNTPCMFELLPGH